MNKNEELKQVEQAWKRIEILLDEDESKYTESPFMLKFPNERTQAFRDRKEAFQTGFVNPAGPLIRSKADSIYKKEIIRTGLTPSQEVFSKRADKSGQTIGEIMHNEVAPVLAAYGTVFAVIDKPPATATTKSQELEKNAYITVLNNSQVLDFEWGEDGELLWFAYLISAPKDRTDPASIKNAPSWGAAKEGIAIWTRDMFMVKDKSLKKDLEQARTHGFKLVPVIIQAQYVKPNHTIGRSTFFAGSRYIIAGNNLIAASNNEVFKNASATLLMNINDYGEDATGNIEHPVNPDTNLKQIKKETSDTANVLLYTNKDDKPEYLVRDLDLIDISQGKGEKYLELAAENEKTSLSPKPLQNQQAGQPESGVSKGYTFDSINKMLSALGNALNHFENQGFKIVAKINDEDPTKASIQYPVDYDPRDYNDRIAFVVGLMKAAFPSKTGMQEAYKAITPEITNSAEIQDKINKEIQAADVMPKPEPTQPKGAN